MKPSTEFLYRFINKQSVCVLSTIRKNQSPEAAAMAFSVTKDLEVIFSVNFESRKLQNIKSNPNVAIVFGWDLEEFITVQYEGVISKITDDLEYYQKIHFAKNPGSEKYKDNPGNTYLLVKPNWIRYSDLKESGFVEEILF